MSQVAHNLGVSDSTLARWKAEMETNGVKAFPGRGTPVEEEVVRLRREVETLRMEREILKKAVGIFSQRSS